MKQSSLRSQFWGGAFDVDPPVSGGFDTCWERWVMASRLLTEQAGTFISRRRWGFFRLKSMYLESFICFTYINWVRKVMCTFFSEKCKNVGQSICKVFLCCEKSRLYPIYINDSADISVYSIFIIFANQGFFWSTPLITPSLKNDSKCRWGGGWGVLLNDATNTTDEDLTLIFCREKSS